MDTSNLFKDRASELVFYLLNFTMETERDEALGIKPVFYLDPDKALEWYRETFDQIKDFPEKAPLLQAVEALRERYSCLVSSSSATWKNGYQRIEGAIYRNIYVVGDLHGCYQSLQVLMHKVQFDEMQDLIVSVGDLIDRGNDSVSCLRLQKEIWFKPVLGNHEAMALEVVEKGNNAQIWYINGGSWYWDIQEGNDDVLKQVVDRLIYQLDNLPYVIEIVLEDRVVGVAHADYPSNDYVFGKDIDLASTLWNRTRFKTITEDLKGGTVPNYPEHSISGIDAFYFGHTPVEEILTMGNLKYIDTGAVFGRALSLVKIKG